MIWLTLLFDRDEHIESKEPTHVLLYCCWVQLQISDLGVALRERELRFVFFY